MSATRRHTAGSGSAATDAPKQGSPGGTEQASTYDPREFAENMRTLADEAQAFWQEMLSSSQGGAAMHHAGMGDPLTIGNTFMEWWAHWWSNPARAVQSHMEYWQEYARLIEHSTRRFLGEEDVPAVASADKKDRRFRDPAWQESAVFDFIKQCYLMTAAWMQRAAQDVDGLDAQTQRKIEFYTRQFVDAMAPSNFVLTNPEVLRATLASNGRNLLEGFRNLREDIARGNGVLSIRMTDPGAFTVGTNLATTPGKVVFRNDLMELLQYAPTTPTVHQRPLLLIPAWINKFYIFDLQQENSFVRWLVAQGYTVFVVSWVNPDASLSEKTFDHYLQEGPLAALDAIEQATGERTITAIGYCLGGTLLAITQAWLKARGQADRIASATYLTTLVDFTEVGELSVFIDEEQLQALETRMNAKGYLEGRDMAVTFNMLRANDLIWSFVVNNYLLGKDPFPFDLLYWNSDSTRMPARMHSFYLRNMYQQNRLVQPGGLTVGGEAIRLQDIQTPTYMLSTREDHIAPWRSTYRATQVYAGETTFVLAASGHVAGVINPPGKEKYCFWESAATPADPEQWLAAAKEHPGSWWPHWHRWNTAHAGPQIPARTPGDGTLTPLADAPGTYVRVGV